MGMGKTARVHIVGGDEEARARDDAIEEAIKATTKSKYLAQDKDVSFWQAHRLFLTFEWLKLGDKAHTTESGTTIKDNFVNVGVVAALLFTMITLDATAVGPEIAQFSSDIVTEETSGKVYVFINSLAMWFLFGAVLHSMYLYCQLSELQTSTEVGYWSESMGFIMLNFHLFYLVVGFVLYILAQAWLVLTYLGLVAGFVSIGIAIFFMAIPLVYASTKSVQAMYNARRKVVKAEATLAKPKDSSVEEGDCAVRQEKETPS